LRQEASYGAFTASALKCHPANQKPAKRRFHAKAFPAPQPWAEHWLMASAYHPGDSRTARLVLLDSGEPSAWYSVRRRWSGAPCALLASLPISEAPLCAVCSAGEPSDLRGATVRSAAGLVRGL